MESGQLAFAAGRIRSARKSGGTLFIDYEPRDGGAHRVAQADAIINCTGPQPRPSASANPFWRSLLRQGVARDAACGVGVDVDMAGHLVNAHGKAHPRLFAVGPPTIGRFAEAVAVPYIVRGILDVVRGIGVAPRRPAPVR